MKLTNAAAATLLAIGLMTSGAVSAQTKSADTPKSQSAQTSKSQSADSQSLKSTQSESASAGQSTSSPLEQRDDRGDDRNWSWLGLLGLLGLAGLMRRRTHPDVHTTGDVRASSDKTGRRVGVYEK